MIQTFKRAAHAYTLSLSHTTLTWLVKRLNTYKLNIRNIVYFNPFIWFCCFTLQRECLACLNVRSFVCCLSFQSRWFCTQFQTHAYAFFLFLQWINSSSMADIERMWNTPICWTNYFQESRRKMNLSMHCCHQQQILESFLLHSLEFRPKLFTIFEQIFNSLMFFT